MSETLAAAQKRISPEFSNSLNVEGALDNSTPTLTLTADKGDDAGDRWQVKNGGNTAGLSVNNDFETKETFGLNCLNLGNILDTTKVAADASNVEAAKSSGNITFANVVSLVVDDRVKISGGLLAAAFEDNADKVLFVKTVDAARKVITVSATKGGDVIKPKDDVAGAGLDDTQGRVFQITSTNTVGFSSGNATTVTGDLTVGGNLNLTDVGAVTQTGANTDGVTINNRVGVIEVFAAGIVKNKNLSFDVSNAFVSTSSIVMLTVVDPAADADTHVSANLKSIGDGTFTVSLANGLNADTNATQAVKVQFVVIN